MLDPATTGSLVCLPFFSEMHHFARSLSSCDAPTFPGLSPLLGVLAGKPLVPTYIIINVRAPHYAGGTSTFIALYSNRVSLSLDNSWFVVGSLKACLHALAPS